MAQWDPYSGRWVQPAGAGINNNVFIPPQPVPVYYPPPSGGTGRAVDHLAHEVHHLAVAESRGRRRSSSRHHHSGSRSRSRSLASLEAELAALRKDGERHAEKEHDKHIIERYEFEQAEKKRKEKDALERMKAQIELDKILAKEKEEKAYKDFELKQAQKKADEEAKKKKQAAEIEAATREQLRKAGYSDGQIDRIIELGKTKDKKDSVVNTTTTVAIAGGGHHHHGGDIIIATGGAGVPRFRAHRHDVSTEVLKRYGIEYRYDPHDKEYLIILRDVDEATMHLLHEETRKHRKGKKVLLIEEEKEVKKKKKDQLLLVRKRSKSRSRSRSRNRGGDKVYVINKH